MISSAGMKNSGLLASMSNTLSTAQLTPFVGRSHELAWLTDLLDDPAVRLITLLGPGGIGKTRLALELAMAQRSAFADGVCVVRLAALRSDADVIPTVAEALGVHVFGDPREQLVAALETQHMLLVLDNFEHVLDAALFLPDLLAAAPGVKVLITSQQKLNLHIETRFWLCGLSCADPGQPDAALDAGAVQMFVQCAQRARPGFEPDDLDAITRICELVEGLPLGILLAAAWIEFLEPREIVSEIKHNLDFLAADLRDIPVRHRSLRAVFESVWQQLSAHEQAIFQSLAVFRGGFTSQVAETVAGADWASLVALTGRSLLRHDPAARRFDMHELLRQYAWERLEADGSAESVCDAHCRTFAALVHDQTPQVFSNQQINALNVIEQEFENIREAWHWAVRSRNYAVLDLMIPGIHAYCDMRSRDHEGEALLRYAVEAFAPSSDETPPATWSHLLLPWYDLRLQSRGRTEDDDLLIPQSEQCLVAARTRQDSMGMACCLVLRGILSEVIENDYARAIQFYEEGLSFDPELDNPFWVRLRIGLDHLALAQREDAIRCFEESLESSRSQENLVRMSWSLTNLATAFALDGRQSEAVAYWQASYEIFRRVGTVMGLVWTLAELGQAALLAGELDTAREQSLEALALARNINYGFYGKRRAQTTLGWLALLEGSYSTAHRHFTAVDPAGFEAQIGAAGAAAWLGDESQALQALAAALCSSLVYVTPGMLALGLGAAARALAGSHSAQAVLLLSAINPWLAEPLRAMWPGIQDLHSELEATMSEKHFKTAWATGQNANLAAAVESLRHVVGVLDAGCGAHERHVLPTRGLHAVRGEMPLVEALTARETEILQLIAAGLSNREIAAHLVLGVSTVKTHLNHIYGKLGVDRRTQAVARARELLIL